MADEMTSRALGAGPRVSVVGLGCNNFGRKGTATQDAAGTRAVLAACLDHGITLLDTADIYGGEDSVSEQLMGKALKELGHDNFVVATKWGHSGADVAGNKEWGPKGSRGYIRQAVSGSLTRLQADVIDLYQFHSPDEATPIEETIAALEELKQEGKIRHYGHSNFSAEQLRAAHAEAKAAGVEGFVSEQGEYSLLRRDVEADVLPAVAECGLGFLPYFPLASGLLSGKYRKGEPAPEGSRLALNAKRFESVTDEEWTRIERYRELCRERGVGMLEATFAWLLAQEEVTSVIAGATTADQVAANARAGSVRIDDDFVATIADLFA